MAELFAVTLMIFAVGTYTFERDLFRFVNRIETAQLQTFASEIEDYYAEVQTWDFLGKTQEWQTLF